MTCEWAMLCHDIEIHQQSGGLTIVGIFTALKVDRLPGTLNPVMLAVRLRGISGETGTCSVVVHDPDGAVLRTVPDQPITLQRPYVEFTTNLGPLSIRKEGEHSIAISIDDVELRRVLMPVDIVRLM